jgi:chromosome segregation ATPase
VLREGVQHQDLTGLLEAYGRAEASREGAIADLAAAEHQKAIEEERLAAQEAALEAEWKAADVASDGADEVLKAATVESEKVRARLSRVKDERARLARDLEAAAAAPDGQGRVDHLKHDDEGAAAEQRTLEEQMARLEPQLADLRAKSAQLRAAAGAARSRLDQALVTRRQVAAAMTASVAGHVRDRAAAEQEAAMLTEQLGRATLQARPAVSSLLSVYQRVDRLQETIADRTSELAALERAAASYDGRKLGKGIAWLVFLVAAAAAAVWFGLLKK